MKLTSLKKFSVIALIMTLLFALPAISAEAQEIRDITFTWTQEGDLTNLAGWYLYRGPSKDGPWTKVVDVNNEEVLISYSGTPADEYTHAQPFEVLVPPGKTVTEHYALTAVDTEGDESAMSEAAIDEDTGEYGVKYKASYDAPTTFTIRAVVKPTP